MPRWSYDEGYAYCSRCGLPITPFDAYLHNMRCPYCGRKVRGDQRAVEEAVQKAMRRVLERI